MRGLADARPESPPGQLNAALAEALGLETTWLESAEGTAVLAGNHVPAG